MGSVHACALFVDGGVRCWGRNDNGEIGDGSKTRRTSPAEPIAGLEAVAITAGASRSCALVVDGSARCWGSNLFGSLGDGTSIERTTPVRVAELADAIQISVEGSSCAVTKDGVVRCWGEDDLFPDGQHHATATRIIGLPPAQRVAVGGSHACALLRDGRVACWGFNDAYQLGDGTRKSRAKPRIVAGLRDAVGIAAYSAASCAWLEDGTVRCWGASTVSNPYGRFPEPTQTVDAEDVIQLGVGWDHTCVLRRDATVQCYGSDEHGQLGRDADAAALALSGIREIAVAADSACARDDSDVWCWGKNNHGQLGDGTTHDREVPTKVTW
jgi:alpha-tubulin suppressor-like RCC1 family protein